MSNLKIEYVSKEQLKPYANNAKVHTTDQIEQIKRSIKEFGFNDPIAVWHDNEIVEGHGRLLAVMEMPEVDKVPIVRLDSLTDEQRKAYTLVHNKLTMDTSFDLDFLEIELSEISEINMEDFGFDLDFEVEEDEPDNFLDDVEGRTSHLEHNVFENQERMQFEQNNYYGIPDLKPTQTCSDQLLRFCDYKDIEDCSQFIAHFYYDDYKFIQAWRHPNQYVDKLKMFKAVIAPDFSLYTDFPRALQILSCYRRNWCGAYWQSLGIDVIPDVVWGDRESYEYCFEGIPMHSVVAVSSVGVTNDDSWNDKKGDLFRAGYEEMLKRLKPTKIIYYGTMLEGLGGNIVRVPSFYESKRSNISRKESLWVEDQVV